MGWAAIGCARRPGRDRGRRYHSRCSPRRAWQRRRRRTARCATGSAAASRRHWRPAPTTTSRAAATARNRSGDRAAPAADRAVTRTGRACRPSCRSHPQLDRPPPSSRQWISGQRIERPTPGFSILSGVHTRRLYGVAQRRRLLTRPFLAAGRGAELDRLFVIGLGYLEGFIGDAAPDLIGFQEFDHAGFGGDEVCHQRAQFLAVGLGFHSGANQGAALLRFSRELGEVVALGAAGLLLRPCVAIESAKRQRRTNDEARGRTKR